MTGLDKITSQIQEEAEASAKERIEAAQKEAEQILADAKAACEAMEKEASDKAAALKTVQDGRIHSAAEQKRKTALLKAKQEIIAEIIGSAYQTLNATGYLENSIPDDAEAIRWLNKNVKGQPVVLEACGDSYQNYDNRVSAMTGLPTVLGWYVHEWLWRNNLEEENQRKADVETIYTSTDKNKIQELIKI